MSRRAAQPWPSDVPPSAPSLNPYAGAYAYDGTLPAHLGVNPGSVAVGDFDGDGDLDILSGSAAGDTLTYFRTTTSAPGWFGPDLDLPCPGTAAWDTCGGVGKCSAGPSPGPSPAAARMQSAHISPGASRMQSGQISPGPSPAAKRMPPTLSTPQVLARSPRDLIASSRLRTPSHAFSRTCLSRTPS